MARRRYYDNGSGYSRRGSSRRRQRRSEERRVEAITFALILVLFLFQLVSSAAFSTPMILLLGGFVLLGSAFFQSARRWRVNPMTWIGGAAMFIFGVLAFQTGVVPLGLGPLLPLLIFAGVIVASFLSGEF